MKLNEETPFLNKKVFLTFKNFENDKLLYFTGSNITLYYNTIRFVDRDGVIRMFNLSDLKEANEVLEEWEEWDCLRKKKLKK